MLRLIRLGWRIVLTVSVLTMAQLVVAQENTGLVWKVTKGENSLYLFGSVHFANQSFYPLPKVVMDAYQSSRLLVVEVDDALVTQEEQAALMQRYGEYPPGKNLVTELSAETLSVISVLLSEFEVPLEAVQQFRPGMLAITLTALQAAKLGFHAEQGLDRYFLQKARYHKPIRQIETFASQMALLRSLPEEDKIVRESFANMKDYKSQWTSTMDAWKKGDAAALYDATIGSALEKHPELMPYFKRLFFDRHEQMVTEAESCIREDEKCFIVVGAGHLVGPEGLVSALAQKGYKLERLGDR